MTLPCNTCKIRFNERSELMAHYKSDLHRTNLILQSNHQPILTQEQYDQMKAEEASKNPPPEEPVDNKEEEDDDDDFDEDDVRDIPDTECLFCGQKFDTAELAYEHMTTHGFRIPYPDKLKDREGLFQYLGEKIGVGNCCLECSKQFRSLNACRDHMRGKYHCAFEFDEEYEDFYEAETGIVPVNYTIDENGEMHLPNGHIIGHKMYQRYYKQRIRDPEDIMKGRRVAIEGPTKPRQSISIDRDKILQKREYFKQKYISKGQRRLVSKDYHPFSDIHRGNGS
ncbi:Zinc finger, C2H2 type family protein [Tritrichomonas foetus]|uniref:Zinc finger, C2H2 type family protein n=1 Tax=Tritrichomonas foetus TaxID=1144522 RepID=A0A1J4KKV6_9EUKA|nr:Zinc finger, C2H2 type family protein [Tritrichomonas foetus]|eukprot:OHT11859.1 Zinc finger, C2H2 type family protein [Tritrichomonas foetus]